MNTLYRYIQLLPLVLTLLLVACHDNQPESDTADLFSMKIYSNEVVNQNTIVLKWYRMLAAKDYTIQRSLSANFEEIDKEITTTDDGLVMKYLAYNTTYYMRVRANASNPVHSSGWLTLKTTTLDKKVPLVLKRINTIDIGEEDVTLYWDKTYPVHHAVIAPMANATPDNTLTRLFTADELAAGSAKVEGLQPTTYYSVMLWGYDAAESADIEYTQAVFKTKGIPATAKYVTLAEHPDLKALLDADQLDSNIPDGQVYVLEAGQNFEIISALGAITKGFSLVSESRNDAAPAKITVKSSAFITTATGTMGYISFEGLTVVSDYQASGAAAGYFFGFSTGATFTIAGIKFDGCDFSGFGRSLIATSGTTAKIISTVVIDNCVVHDAVATYSILNFSGGSNYPQVPTVSVTNSTFRDITGTIKGLIAVTGTSTLLSTNMTVANCTFRNFSESGGTNTGIVNLTTVQSGTITINKCLFAKRNSSMPICIKGGCSPAYTFNYLTADAKDVVTVGVAIGATVLTQHDDALFVDPDHGDLTIKDTQSVIYTEMIGDPRWIKY